MMEYEIGKLNMRKKFTAESITNSQKTLPTNMHLLTALTSANENTSTYQMEEKLKEINEQVSFNHADKFKTDEHPADCTTTTVALQDYNYQDYWLFNKTEDPDENFHIHKPANRTNIKHWFKRLVWKTEKIQFVNEYPDTTRPILTKGLNSTANAIMMRLYNVEKIRKHTHGLDEQISYIAKQFFKPNYQEISQNYKRNRIGLNVKLTEQWCNEHKFGDLKAKNMIEQQLNKMLIKPISDIKIHVKKENLTKDDYICVWEKQKARTIMWQDYAIAMIFSPVFMQLKTRLKDLLNNNTLYTDGWSLKQINTWLSTKHEGNWIIEDDLTKQDRQTDKDLLEVEFKIYESLGMDLELLNLWKQVHKTWFWKSDKMMGSQQEMRLTGQATTSLGNFIVNMTVHAKLLNNTKENTLNLFLGDDSLFITKNWINVTKWRQYIATYHNMKSKAQINGKIGSFIQLLIMKNNNGCWHLVPNLLRVKNRFEVVSNETEKTSEQLIQRQISLM